MLRRRVSSATHATIGIAALAAVILGLTACGPESATPTPTPAPGDSTAAPENAAPTYLPDGTAEENLPLFSQVTAQVWSSDQRVAGRAYIDALIAAGFDREAMQVTQDATTVGNPAESLQFSVRWGSAECLVGQVGPSTGEPLTVVMPQLAEGRCLVGTTRAIDW